ncbi:MAG TPA: DNA-directed RNA polymerase subunit beta [Candidatus Scatocola faecipullorum]|jgi:DNA-directed RNA polymerase, beta subunit|uniref:DNA-directed RNA polymerase subunit beta n=1 Tax=Candidatus Scatocola faecipullorum TaxID=2840917 RepID=A0A9D1M3C5_9PROT|nr:DNA-directed RNA polymerase subunit beta [Candidatus Scatocola faecipullorum]
MKESYTSKRRVRRNFGRIDAVSDMPSLIEVQTGSYADFIESDKEKGQCEFGLEEVFKSIFPIKDFSGSGELEFVKYELEEPKYDVDECIKRDMTYAAPVKATLRLVVWDIDEATGAKSIHDIKEQDVYMGDIPLMTDKGTFIFNGTERVVVSQMHRSPGVFFDHDKGKTVASGKYLFAARIIPYRGSWLDFEFDAKDLVYARIDRRRKLPVTSILYSLYSKETEDKIKELKAQGKKIDPSEIKGMDKEEILSYFYDVDTYVADKKAWKVKFLPERMKGVKFDFDLVNTKTGETVWEKGKKMTPRSAQKLADEGLEFYKVSPDQLFGKFLATAVINPKTGEIIADAGAELNEEVLTNISAAKVGEIKVLYIDNVNVGPYIRNTLEADKNHNREEALLDIYRVMRPGEPPTYETADQLFRSLFFDNDRYDLSSVGRVKMNVALDISFEDAPDTYRTLRKDDILRIVKRLVELRDGKGEVDDIDHLGNRRVRSVGELMENQYRMGLLRMERAIRERMSSESLNNVKPQDLVNAKPIASVIREFFGSSQLSQFMDQNNPLSEITHKRRLSALGPGGLSRDRAGFEVRDVHPTHYGRICPIETPEGPNIGLINSLSTYARINKYGFIECPYRKVVNGVVTNEVVYLSANEEGKFKIAEANAKVKDDGHFENDLIACRKAGEFEFAHPEEVDFIDVSPQQLVSVATALIPFLENDDANRALMGANMQRQGVPLLRSEAPLVGTGMEATVAKDSGATVVAKYDGIVDAVDANRIVVRSLNDNVADAGVEIYKLQKFRRSNQNTCINQVPLVKVGDHVKAGDIMADGPCTDMGELALGRNLLVAFMPWNGLNYEDAILLSENISRNDVLTSLHIEEFEVMARDTKLGQEEITRDIPNVGEEALRNLDEAGIVYIGAEVKAGDILVGKVTPKGESPVTPEEKLLRAIFGEKASDVRDTSLRVQPGIEGIVVDVHVFSRRGVEKDERALSIEQEEISQLAKDRDDEIAIIRRSFEARLQSMLMGQKVVDAPKGIAKNATITEEVLSAVPSSQWRKIVVKDEEVMARIEEFLAAFDARVEKVQKHFENKVEKVQRGDDLLPGVLKMVKVFIATKRKIQTGDKIAGRHGNKGTISRVLPLQDMPYMEDGTPVDIVLNPLGVPSRMNVGQILETHLGWAASELGKQLNEMCEQYKRGEKTIDELNAKLKAIYGEKQYKNDIEPMNEAEKLEMISNLKNGVPMATPVFDGAHEDDINNMLELAGLPTSGQIDLYDGRTGEKFDRKVTVGTIYMIKLHHIVDEKMHARSVGPYSLVTQQPLGGKAQFGGQRFGEMEVWALQAYGAAYTLQEMLTVKSDDVNGRTKVYEAIVRGDDGFEAGVPESFNVLVKEIKSLCLNVELLNEEV